MVMRPQLAADIADSIESRLIVIEKHIAAAHKNQEEIFKINNRYAERILELEARVKYLEELCQSK
jgi:hypothetical protein